MSKSAEVAPGRVAVGGVYVDSLSSLGRVASLSAWPGTSATVLGRKVWSGGAELGGKVSALNSAILSFGEAMTPGLCWGGAVLLVTCCCVGLLQVEMLWLNGCGWIQVVGLSSNFPPWTQTKVSPVPRGHEKETYYMGNVRLISRPVRMKFARGLCHGVYVSSCHADG